MSAMAMPTTRFTRVGDLHLAYQVWGDGPVDVVLVWGTMSHAEIIWEDPKMVRFFERLGRSVRVIQFDRIGTGLSDRPDRVPTLEDRMDDLLAVVDAVGCDRVALLGESEGGPTSILFSATHPERVSHLVLYAPLVRLLRSEDFPIGMPRDVCEQFVEFSAANWGETEGESIVFPEADEQRIAWFARFRRMASSPKAWRDTMFANFDIDIRPVLPTLSVPTLVLHKADDILVSAEQGRYAAEHIPGARYIELRGVSHYLAEEDADRTADLTVEFVTGSAPAEEAERVLATVLFTDIVASTEKAVALGDQRWRDLLDDHDKVIRDAVERFRGRLVKTTGDGALATFDGPARAVRAGDAIVHGVQRLGIEARAGVHTGEVELRGADVGGVGVHIGARVAALAAPTQVLVSRTVIDLVVGSQLEFSDAGTHTLKGVPGSWPLFALASEA
jgi:class 3 adenylate cyclase